MKFKTFGNENNKPVMLLHGGGLSWWSLQNHVDALKDTYYVIAATIDGHGDDAQKTFTAIEDCADQIVEYINNNFGGQIYAIGGLSIGAQITIEVLSRNASITKKAIIDSGLVIPMKMVSSMIKPMYNMCYGLIKHKWFSKYQAKALFVPENMFDSYYEDSMKMSKESLINMILCNNNYSMPETLKNSEVDALIIVGEKELKNIKKSGELLNKTLKNSALTIIDKNGHGEFSLKTPKKYIALITKFLE